MAAAHPIRALSPRLPAARRPDQPRRARVARHPAADSVRARAGHRRAGDDRCARHPDRAARSGAALLRSPPAGMQGAHSSLWNRPGDRGHESSPSPATRAGSHPPARPSVTPGWTSLCTSLTRAAPPGASPGKDRPRCAGRCLKPRNAPGGAAPLTMPTTPRRPSGSVATGPASPLRANCSNAATTPCANSARRPSNPHDLARARQALRHPDAPRPAPGKLLPPPASGRPFIDRAAATLPPAGSPHQPSCRRPGTNPDRGPR